MPISALLNGAYDTVAGAPTTPLAGLLITVNNAGRWPDPLTVGPYPVSVWATGQPYTNDAGTRCMVTSKSGAVLTVVRDIEGSGTRAILVGDQIALLPAKQDMQSLASNGSRNLLVNGGFRIWQRQAPATPTTRTDDTFFADRWIMLTQGTGVNCSRIAGLVSGYRSSYVGLLTQAVGGSQRMGAIQIVEGFRSQEMRGETLRFDIRSNGVAGPIRIAIIEWTGAIDAVTSDVVLNWASGTFTPNNFFLAASLTIAAVNVFTTSAGASASVLGSVRATISASCNNLIVMAWTENAQAFGQDWVIGDAQLVLDSVSEAYVSRDIATEITECQRFYEKSWDIDTVPGTAGEAGAAFILTGTNTAGFIINATMFQTRKRGLPVIAYWDGAGNASRVSGYNAAGGAAANQVNGFAPDRINQHGFCFPFQFAAGTQAGCLFHWSAEAEL